MSLDLTPKYTYVIPVYNVERYLRQCVDSILNQTYKNYEIILVDDGSTDSSGQICDQYASNYANIYVYHKCNGGLSSARNYGLREVQSKYVIFLDSDDYWFDADGLSKLDNCIADEEVDITFFRSYDLNDRDGKLSLDRYNYPDRLNMLRPDECINEMIKIGLLNLSASKKVFSTSFLRSNNLYFKERFLSEDVEQGIRALNHLPVCKVLNEPIYVYRHREGSITTERNINRIKKHLEDRIWIVDTYSKSEYYRQSIQQCMMSYVGYQYILILAAIAKLNSPETNPYLNKLRKYSFLLQYHDYPRTRLISIIYRLIGFNGTCKTLGIYLCHKM